MDTEILCIVAEQVKFKYGHEVPVLYTVLQDKNFPIYKFRIFKFIFTLSLGTGKTNNYKTFCGFA